MQGQCNLMWYSQEPRDRAHYRSCGGDPLKVIRLAIPLQKTMTALFLAEPTGYRDHAWPHSQAPRVWNALLWVMMEAQKTRDCTSTARKACRVACGLICIRRSIEHSYIRYISTSSSRYCFWARTIFGNRLRVVNFDRQRNLCARS